MFGGEDGSPDLLKVTLDVLDPAICNKSFDVEIRTTNMLSRGIDSQMLCAGVLNGGKDTCQGDSGGALLSPNRELCVFVVLGVTSFGKVCAFANSPAVYARVSEYIPWIESVIP
ncbi:hypothetical protein J437_LFUL011096 [Ladona fulva]|uniref:Peptidase S1 domain-containing protein n=1 Tax=Ladona fulva TaxID=123851 RepID=A0A8K0KGK8_LADFU|nr:hypothetical protein J437_LFUL011096 [Ladona fulva]